MSPLLLDLLWQSLLQTLEMVLVSGAVACVAGLPLALLLVITDRDGTRPVPIVNRAAGAIVNAVRSIPFIILLIILIPVTRLLAGTSLGTGAAIIPLSIACIPYYARIAAVSLREVDRGLVDAVRAMGGGTGTVIRHVLVPEALPGLVSGFAVTLVTLVGASAMAGAIGAGGLGDLAIRYGYQRFETGVMIAVVVVLIVLVSAIQFVGDLVSGSLDRR